MVLLGSPSEQTCSPSCSGMSPSYRLSGCPAATTRMPITLSPHQAKERCVCYSRKYCKDTESSLPLPAIGLVDVITNGKNPREELHDAGFHPRGHNGQAPGRVTAEDRMARPLGMDTSLPPWLPPEGHVCLDSSQPAQHPDMKNL